MPPYQAAIINGFTPQTLARLIRAGLATDNAGPPLALSPSAASGALGPADPARRFAQAVAALPEALVGLPFGTRAGFLREASAPHAACATLQRTEAFQPD